MQLGTSLIATRRWEMESFLLLVGIGFVILCIGLLVGFTGIFKYIVKLSKEKIEVSPAKSNPNSNEHIE